MAEKQDDIWRSYIRESELLFSSAEHARTYYHYASDEMGSITHITNGDRVLNSYSYDAWGEVVSEREEVSNRFKFNGQQLDPITGQYYLRARYYNPVIGRFTQEDTYRGDGLNLYAYCRNNPVYYVDPTGHDSSKVNSYQDARDNEIELSTIEGASNSVLENANYAQKTYSKTFSEEGRKIYSSLAGEPINTIDDLVSSINKGKINVVDLPVEYIVRDGNTLILNTRTSQALTQAGIPRRQWSVINRTGDSLFEGLLTGQLERNKLTSEGILTVRPSGGK